MYSGHRQVVVSEPDKLDVSGGARWHSQYLARIGKRSAEIMSTTLLTSTNSSNLVIYSIKLLFGDVPKKNTQKKNIRIKKQKK